MERENIFSKLKGPFKRQEEPEITLPPLDPEILSLVQGLGKRFDQILSRALGETRLHVERLQEAKLGTPIGQEFVVKKKVLDRHPTEANLFAALAGYTDSEFQKLDIIMQYLGELFAERFNIKNAQRFVSEMKKVFDPQKEESFWEKLLEKLGIKESIDQIYSKVTGNAEIRNKTLEAVANPRNPLLGQALVTGIGALLDTAIATQEKVEGLDREISKNVRNLNRSGSETVKAIVNQGKVLEEFRKIQEQVENSPLTPDRIASSEILSNPTLDEKISELNGGQIDEEDIKKYVQDITNYYHLARDAQTAITEALKSTLKTTTQGERIKLWIAGRNILADYMTESLRQSMFLTLLYIKLRALMLQTMYDIAQTKNATARGEIIRKVQEEAENLRQNLYREISNMSLGVDDENRSSLELNSTN